MFQCCNVEIKNFKIASVNHRTIPVRRGKKLSQILDPNYKKSLNDLAALLREKKPGQFLMVEKDVEIEINVATFKDIDNILKLIIDSLKKAEFYKSDRYLMALLVNKTPIKRGTPESMRIYIEGQREDG